MPTNLPCKEKTRELRFREMANSVLKHSEHERQLINLMNKLRLDEERVINSFLEYNMDIKAFDNEVYDSIANRFVLHIHNILEGSFHQKRQDEIIRLLEKIKPSNVIDIGFGVPSRFVRDLALKNKLFKTTLCDLYEDAFKFAKVLLEQWHQNWHEMISFKKTDMNNVHLIGDFDVYLFQESIEHVQDPTTCLKKYVQLSPPSAKFILYLPINAPIPAHFIVWNSHLEAETWLGDCGLKIEEQIHIKPNESIDLFADVLGNDYYNVLFSCTKLNQHERINPC